VEQRFEPAYLALWRSGELKRRVEEAYRHLERCDLCANQCGVNRRETTQGAVCRTGEQARVASYHPHFGEEAPLVGHGGSGTIFFSWCNLRCQFCQNYDISQVGMGEDVTPQEIATMMLQLQAIGSHNINLVSPSHVVAQSLAALLIAVQAGLRLPIVYNSGGYDSPQALALLDGVVDIYMPDMKYADAEIARRYSKIRDYPAVNRAAVREMHRQVGDLQLDARGIAQRGLLVRHLVLPDDLAGTRDIVHFLATAISPHTYLNLMDQYRPCYKAGDFPELGRPITRREYAQAVAWAEEAGLDRLDQRAPRRQSFLIHEGHQ